MSLNNEAFQKKLENRCSQFSSRFMSDAKWLKLFRLFSNYPSIFLKIYFITIWNENPRILDISDSEKFDQRFNTRGINDVIFAGPLLFKEIRCLEFPASWSVMRRMRNEFLKPQIYNQDLGKIYELIKSIGEFEIEHTESYLKIYAYR